MYNFSLFERLDGNTNSVTLDNTYLNIVEIFNNFFLMNNIKIENLIVKPTQKKGYKQPEKVKCQPSYIGHEKRILAALSRFDS